MRKSAVISLLALALLFIPVTNSQAWHGHRGGHGRVVIGVGPPWWWDPFYFYPPYPYWYPPPYYPYPSSAIVVQDPPVYIQQPSIPSVAPPQTAPQAYWYYCPGAQAYYPNVQRCSEAWIKVPPTPR